MQVYWGFGEFGCRLYRATFELEEFRATPSAPRKKRTRKKMKTVVIRKDAPQTISTSWSSSTRWRPCPPAATTTRTRRSPACRLKKLGHNQGDATCRTMEPAIGTIDILSNASDLYFTTEMEDNTNLDLFTIKVQKLQGRAVSVVYSREASAATERSKCSVQTKIMFGSSEERIIADRVNLPTNTTKRPGRSRQIHLG